MPRPAACSISQAHQGEATNAGLRMATTVGLVDEAEEFSQEFDHEGQVAAIDRDVDALRFAGGGMPIREFEVPPRTGK